LSKSTRLKIRRFVPLGIPVIENAGGVVEQAAVPVQLKCTPNDPAKEAAGNKKPVTIRVIPEP
jgi:hypothetical protein